MSSKIVQMFATLLLVLVGVFTVNSAMAQLELPPIPIPKAGKAPGNPAPRLGGSRCPPGFTLESNTSPEGKASKICIPGVDVQERINKAVREAEKKAAAKAAPICSPGYILENNTSPEGKTSKICIPGPTVQAYIDESIRKAEEKAVTDETARLVHEGRLVTAIFFLAFILLMAIVFAFITRFYVRSLKSKLEVAEEAAERAKKALALAKSAAID